MPNLWEGTIEKKPAAGGRTRLLRQKSLPQNNSQSADSLHKRIQTEIRAKIMSGEWPPGHRIPFEHELTAHYGCSRMTVNKALTQLATAGLIQRKRKIGTFVARPQSQSAVLDLHEIRSEVIALGLAYSFEVLKRRKRAPTPDERKLFASRKAEQVLEILCRHFAGGQPFCVEERLISLGSVPTAASETFRSMPPGAWLISRIPWTTAEHRIRAEAADARTAKNLGIVEGSPCLVIERRTWHANRTITAVKLTYPGEAHQLVSSFAPK